MQRHRYDQIAAVDQAAPGPLQPQGEARHQIQPVGMLERQDRSAAGFVIAQDGARRVESRRVRQTGGAKRIVQRHIERNAATGAEWTIQELDGAPALGAKTAAGPRLAAGDAEGWKQQVKKAAFPRKAHTASLTAMNPVRPPIFDFRTARMARARAARLDGDRFLERAAMEGLADRLATVTRRFGAGLMIGAPAPEALAAFAAEWLQADFDAHEILEAGPGRFDLAISIFSLQAINDLPGALVQIRRALKPDGLFLGVLFGGTTLSELRESFVAAESETRGGISPRVSPFADVRDMGGLLQRSGFALPVADVERLTARYGDFSGLARDLRAHGQTNALSDRRKGFLRRNTLAALLAHYRAHHATDNKLHATFETVYLTGWAPDASQQQPLKPGSAITRLADALGTTEHKAGEITGGQAPPRRASN